MDYEKLKTELKEIADIALLVPEPFREKCFEILLQRLLQGDPPTKIHEPKIDPLKPVEKPGKESPNGTIPVKSQLRVFLQRTGVTLPQLQKLVLVDNDEVHFIHEPTHGKVAKGQTEWALLLALKQAIQQNEFSTDPEDVRSICQEKGFYDSPNFAANLKRPPLSSYFKQPLQPQGTRQALSNEGQTALAELITELTQNLNEE